MSRICPHCKHVRSTADNVPDWQCPSCEKAYVKAGRPLPPASLRQYGPAVPIRRGFSGKWRVALLLLFAAVWFGWPRLQQRIVHVDMAAQPEVVLYATEWCGYCKMTREFFAANGIRYTEEDIEKSSTALSQHKKLGGVGVPLIVVDGEVVNGYNEPALRQLLGPWIKG